MELLKNSTYKSYTSSKYEKDLKHVTKIVSNSQREFITLINYVVLCGIISAFGIAANVINMVIFYKQGLNTTINISFFAMAISDLCSLIIQVWFNLCVNPLFEKSGLPFIFTDVQYMTGGVPRETFARITCLITVYITAERCLCITFPLKVKQMITSRRTAVIIISVFAGTCFSGVPFYCTSYIGWKFSPEMNKTLLGLILTGDSIKAQGALYILHAIFGVVSFLAVVIFTLILIQKLGQKRSWRKSANVLQDKSESLSNRDRTTMSMIVLIASILIICYIPAVLLCVTTFYEPEFSVAGRYYNLYYILWSVAVLFENINSSVNIFLYFKMSTKYRQAFRGLFSLNGPSVRHAHNGLQERRYKQRRLCV